MFELPVITSATVVFAMFVAALILFP